MKRILSLLAFLFCLNLASAQLVKFKHRVAQGGLYNWIRVVNDSDIYAIKFLAGGDVQHYNGYTWTSYKRTNYPWIMEAEVGANGQIWLGTRGGLYLVDTSWVLEDIDNKPLVIGGMQVTDTVSNLTFFNNKLWFTTPHYLAYIHQNQIQIYHQDSFPFLSGLKKATDLAIDKNGYVLLSTPTGIIQFNGYNARTVLPSKSIIQFHKDKFDEIWFTDIQGVLYRWNNGQPIVMRSNDCNVEFYKAGCISSNGKGDILVWENQVPKLYSVRIFGLYNTLQQRAYHISDWSGPATGDQTFVDSKIGSYIKSNYGDTIFELNVDSLKMSLNPWDKYTTDLDANNIKMPIISDAIFGWNLQGRSTRFPKTDCKTNMFCGSLWLGGVANDSKKAAVQTYRQNGLDFYPGPITKQSGALVFKPKPQYESPYYKPRKVTKAAIDKFKLDFAKGGPMVIAPEILNWPAHGDTLNGEAYFLAPFVDVNQDGKYNPYQGDYPDIKGDMAVYNIINDFITHSESDGTAFGIEMHVMAYAYACADMPSNSPNQTINNTVFFQYKIINRSDTNYNSVKPAVFLDVDIGNYQDDYIACNPKVGYAYGFNGDAFDENYTGYSNGYGNRPATISVVPLGVDSNTSYLRGMVYYNNDFSKTGNPSRAEHYSSYLNAQFKDGLPITYGGLGRDTTSSPTTYMFPGDDDLQGRPNWSMKSAGIKPQDMRLVALLNPFNLNAGADTSFTFALVASLPIDSASTYQTVKNDAIKVKGWFAANNYPTCGKLIAGLSTSTPKNTEVLVFPNPAQHTIEVKHQFNTETTFEIISVDGRLLWKGNNKTGNTISIENFANGLYLLRVSSVNGTKTIKFIKE